MNSRRAAMIAVFFIALIFGACLENSRTAGTAIAQLVAVLVLCAVCASIVGRRKE